MDPRKFDALVQKLSQRLTRRAAVGGSVSASLLSAAALIEEALAKGKGKGKQHDGGGDGGHGGGGHGGGHGGNNGPAGRNKQQNQCQRKRADKQDARAKKREDGGAVDGDGGVNTEKGCLPDGKKCPQKKKTGHGKHKHHKTKGCDRCCHHFTRQQGGKTVCACKPDGTSCLNGGVALPTDCCSGICGPGNICGSLS